MDITVVRTDITTLDVDAIVNAANSSLYGGGGVDGAIHRAAGPRLYDACREIRQAKYPQGLPTGEAVAAPGYDLPARWVILTVGPVFAEHLDGGPSLLAACYTRSLDVADDLGLASVAFPAISTGVFGWPADRAGRVAVEAVRSWGDRHPDGSVVDVRLVAFSREGEASLLDALSR
jgi:O-acetyl-ADP-ribose deacetylase (regulator of RNase III)